METPSPIGAPLSPYYENLLPLQISTFTLCATRYLYPTRYSSLEVSYCFPSLYSLIEQTSIEHPLCARPFREARRIILTLTSKKADIHEVTHPHSELCLLYMLDMRRRRQWQPTPVLLPGKFQGWWSLVGCCLWGRTESDTTEVS